VRRQPALVALAHDDEARLRRQPLDDVRLDALVAGTTDPVGLAELAKGRLRAKLPALREALEGRFESALS
jgi:hypothetical protein